jgi:hypothetical protein
MSRLYKGLAAAVLAAGIFALPGSASAYGPVRVIAARTVVRAPIAAVRTARVVAPPYYAPRVYAPLAPRVLVAPPFGPVIYVN